MPPKMIDGNIQGAITMSEGTLILEGDTHESVTIATEPHSEEVADTVDHAMVEVVEAEETREAPLAAEQNHPSALEEVVEQLQGSSTDSREEQTKVDTDQEMQICVKNIVQSESRDKLAKAVREDESLLTTRKLADEQQEGYHWVEQLLFRTRQDVVGDTVEQLCLPKPYRNRCLTLTHDRFGHAGRNRMTQYIRRYFYWPSLTADSAKHVKLCETCQKADKSAPKKMMMQTRELVSVPSERVAIDIVGPFPVARGWFRYLLTCLDMATRWPEAIQLRKTTTAIIIQQLTHIFARIGFPTSLVSDNGPQFVSASFTAFLKDKGITHVRASPYHPQGNGLVERLHRTLNAVITKCH